MSFDRSAADYSQIEGRREVLHKSVSCPPSEPPPNKMCSGLVV